MPPPKLFCDGRLGQLAFELFDMQKMDSISYRRFASFEYVDPENLLKKLLPIVESIQQGTELAKNLNSHQLKIILEQYQAALFAYILGQNKHSIRAVSVCIKENDDCIKEDEDFDCVIKTLDPDGKIVFRPVQLKEFSNHDPKKAEIQSEINKLKKYSHGLAVVFWMNRDVKIDLSQINLSGLKIEQLWFMGESASHEVTLHGGNLCKLMSGLCLIRTLSFGWKIETYERPFKPYQAAKNI
jgi:hypothetical protein